MSYFWVVFTVAVALAAASYSAWGLLYWADVASEVSSNGIVCLSLWTLLAIPSFVRIMLK